MITAFPKIHTVGAKETQYLFSGELEITEKLDGSAIAFGMVDNQLVIRSKSKQLDLYNPDKMFAKAVEVIIAQADYLTKGMVYYGEYLKSNKHNSLIYDHPPRNHIALYGITFEGKHLNHEEIRKEADIIDLDVVYLLFKGNYPLQKNGESSLIAKLMDTTSGFGNCKIEGIVLKNYSNNQLIMGKYVSEEFKEVRRSSKTKKIPGEDRFDQYKSQFHTEARWVKAVQHLRDNGTLTNDTKDIGHLLKEINMDLQSEEKENIKDWLWKEYGKQILKHAAEGFPQWYKEYLLKNAE